MVTFLDHHLIQAGKNKIQVHLEGVKAPTFADMSSGKGGGDSTPCQQTAA